MDYTRETLNLGEATPSFRKADASNGGMTADESVEILSEPESVEILSDASNAANAGSEGEEDNQEGLQAGEDGAGPTYNGRPIFKDGPFSRPFSLPPELVSVFLAFAT